MTDWHVSRTFRDSGKPRANETEFYSRELE